MIRFKEENKPNKLKLSKQEQDLKNEKFRAWKSGVIELLGFIEDARKNGDEFSIDRAQKAYNILAQRVQIGEKVPEFFSDKILDAQTRYNELMKSRGYPQEYRLNKKTRQPMGKAKIKRFSWIIGLVFVSILVIFIKVQIDEYDDAILKTTKLYFAERLIEYPEDLTIEDAKIEKIRKNDIFIEYQVSGLICKTMCISEFDVTVRRIISDGRTFNWFIGCDGICPERVDPPDDINSEKYKKWEELWGRLKEVI
ncbi:hypothetical protein [Paenibacillus sp. Soil750]|uniref:hypothetical protein n=1 Tax=Paenibacillus sp. Soil750 TaxID=1736398 RepID=UPI0006FDA171|nr:hypothetical protein [Paenibacillus sp. Soil750]KRE70862.1 hypothetical protein ASL11_11250 [Paenibacillus sp. Soil750]